MTSTDSFFDNLKQHRESQDIDISEICEFTKINPKYIQSIEEGNFQILPNVYMRLFLRAYAKYIGADSEKALVDYALYTTGKISSSLELEIKPKTVVPIGSFSSGQITQDLSQISPKKIATGVGVLLGIFLILFWAGKITEEQNQEIQSIPIDEKNTQTEPDSLEINIVPSLSKTAQPTEESTKKKN